MPPKSMGAGQNINIRFTDDLLEQIDAYIATLAEQNPGLTVSRSDIVRMAVKQLTRSVEPAPKPKKSAK